LNIQTIVDNRVLGAYRYTLAAGDTGFFPASLHPPCFGDENVRPAGIDAGSAAVAFSFINENSSQIGNSFSRL
jgi:hypothetical protein